MPRKRTWHKQARGRSSHPTTFGIVLYNLITRRGWSANEFARRVGVSSGFISGIYTGFKRPPVKRLGKWVRALKLEEHEARAFRLLAELEHAKIVAPTLHRAFLSNCKDPDLMYAHDMVEECNRTKAI